jgi:hypothetical protein
VRDDTERPREPFQGELQHHASTADQRWTFPGIRGTRVVRG